MITVRYHPWCAPHTASLPNSSCFLNLFLARRVSTYNVYILRTSCRVSGSFNSYPASTSIRRSSVNMRQVYITHSNKHIRKFRGQQKWRFGENLFPLLQRVWRLLHVFVLVKQCVFTFDYSRKARQKWRCNHAVESTTTKQMYKRCRNILESHKTPGTLRDTETNSRTFWRRSSHFNPSCRSHHLSCRIAVTVDVSDLVTTS